MMRVTTIFLASLLLAGPALAQQNQTPGDTNSGGTSQSAASGKTAAQGAQSGANTSDATTTGASGPQKKSSGPPGAIALPPLPSEKLCSNYTGDVKTACLSTTTNGMASATGAAQ